MGKEMLKLLEVPKSVTDNLETIDTIEKALHKVGKIELLLLHKGSRKKVPPKRVKYSLSKKSCPIIHSNLLYLTFEDGNFIFQV